MSLVFLHDPVRRRQAEPTAFRLGTKKWIEDFFALLRRDTDALVLNTKTDIAPRREWYTTRVRQGFVARAQPDATALRHRLFRIYHEIVHDLRDLTGVDFYGP